MSRTIRRKNFEKTQGTSWDRQGDKIAGLYTEYDYKYPVFQKNYRLPTDTERYKKWRYFHGESSTANAYSPSREHRNYRESRLRTFNNIQLRKWLDDPEYDPVFLDFPLSHMWDWS